MVYIRKEQWPLILVDTCTAHVTDIFSLAVTPTQIISGSGSSSLKIYSTTDPDYPLQQTIDKAHGCGCHHVVTSVDGSKAASAGFGGEVKIWIVRDGHWSEEGKIVGADFLCYLLRKFLLDQRLHLFICRWQQGGRDMGNSFIRRRAIPCKYDV